ncbi:MAG: aspartate 1-decarboxylase [Deltaproteobacteria bacterium]
MQRFMLKSKIHRAAVTDADLHYEGSITIDETLMDAADILPYEKVNIYNVSNGERFSTYVIKGKRDSGVICVNGAAAWKASKGDIVIIASYAIIDDQSIKKWSPKCVFLDERNSIKTLT